MVAAGDHPQMIGSSQHTLVLTDVGDALSRLMTARVMLTSRKHPAFPPLIYPFDVIRQMR
jgi:hypothetical protein